MKKLFQLMGLIVLVCVSFIYTEKAMLVVREQDPLMIELNSKKDSYYKAPIQASIDGENIIPGYEGIEVDVGLSYENMKKYGLYNESMLKFNNVIPDKSVSNIFNKYIVSGNRQKNSVSLVFFVNKNDDITKIVEILNRNNVNATFFVEKQYIESNKEMLKSLVSSGNEVGHTNYSSDEDLLFSNKLVSSLGREFNYCYTDKNNKDLLKLCSSYSMHVVKPVVIGSNNITIQVKKSLDSGVIFGFNINKGLNEELDHIITYIKQKGYTISVISEHLNEKRLEK